MVIRIITLLQRMSLDMVASPCKNTSCVPMHVFMCRTKHLRSLFSLLCIVYQFSFSLDLWEGEVLRIRPKPGNGHTMGHTGIHTCPLGHLI